MTDEEDLKKAIAVDTLITSQEWILQNLMLICVYVIDLCVLYLA